MVLLATLGGSVVAGIGSLKGVVHGSVVAGIGSLRGVVHGSRIAVSSNAGSASRLDWCPSCCQACVHQSYKRFNAA